MRETAITNLLYRYAEYIDGGDLAGAASLFRNAKIKVNASGDLLTSDALLALWQNQVILYPDGTPRTKHVVSNPIIDLDETAGTATCRSYYTVMQAVDGLPLQVIVCGRYYDEFTRVGDNWQFSFRDYSLLDMIGNIKYHIKYPDQLRL